MGELSTIGRVEMCVWLLLLHHNRGLRFRYIFEDIPVYPRRIHIDVASTEGIEGYAAYTYFPIYYSSTQETYSPRLPGHYLIPCLDHSNVLPWLSLRRSSSPYVCIVVSVIERLKWKFLLKNAARYISSAQNISPNLLSHNTIPEGFLHYSTRVYSNIARLFFNLLTFKIWYRWSNNLPSSCLP